MKTFSRVAVIASLCAVVLGVLAWPGSADPSVSKDLAAARRATARFHDVNVALSDGYVAEEVCVARPDGAVMGMHYANPALARDPALDVEHPGILLYLPTSSGPQLIGVEYFKADADQNLATDPDRPSLFGQPFQGPMPGHNPQMPIHYDLHVWIWAHNPDGMFAPFNPSLSCPAP